MKVGFIGLGTMGASMAAQSAKGGPRTRRPRHPPRRGRASPRGRRGVGRLAEGAGRAVRGHLHLAARPARGRGGGARAERAHRGHEATAAPISTCRPTRRPWCARSTPRFAEKHLYMLDAPVSGGPKRRGHRQARALGRRRRADLQPPQEACSTRSATRPAISARSAPARSPSWCTIAPATRSSASRSPRSSRWASRPGSSRWRCGRRCARARPAGGAPSTRSATTSCPSNYDPPTSRCASPTRT